jgi:hypothetical protein
MRLDLGERQTAYESLGDDATRTRIGKASYLLATREQLNTVPEPCRLTACTDPRPHAHRARCPLLSPKTLRKFLKPFGYRRTAPAPSSRRHSRAATLLRCYQQPDDATMLAVMSHDRGAVGQQKGA